MKPEKLTPAQQVFINEMVNGASQKQAYMAAYPGSSAEAAYSSASRLMDKPHIRREIEQQTERIAWTKQEIMAGQYAGRLVTISKQREALTAAFDKKHTKEETITNFKGQARHRIAFDLRQRIDAIKLDERLYKEWNKLMGDIKDGDMISSVMTQIHALKEPAIAHAVAGYHALPGNVDFFTDEEMQEDKNAEKEANFLANVSKYDYDAAAFLSMAEKDNGISEEDSPENAEKSCETLANGTAADFERSELPAEEEVQTAPAQPGTRYMNRKQRRAAEQYRKRLAAQEEKLRILLHS